MPSSTRGFGLLESWLAHARAQTADALIPETLRDGTIVDIGCGVPALFLEQTRFARKIGIDIRGTNGMEPVTGIERIVHDAWAARLPLADASADVVTLLATLEHVPPARTHGLLTEISRILKTDGVAIITTPTRAARLPLAMLAAIRFVSPAEIEDHKQSISLDVLTQGVINANLLPERTGTFEWGYNRWLVARRSVLPITPHGVK